MSFLRRLFGARDIGTAAAEPADVGTPDEVGVPEADEGTRELELLRAEQARLDPLRERQLRYADRAWTPPRQGGERRAGDADTDTPRE
ncbi:MAG TPA: hypothetical protein VFI28_12020 [Candidatus Limnocylindrales bacterium]|nr:hypothetical protein [Candidatus Limnocylindrales bacterium]